MKHLWADGEFGVSCIGCGYFRHSAAATCDGKFYAQMIGEIEVRVSKLLNRKDQIKQILEERLEVGHGG